MIPASVACGQQRVAPERDGRMQGLSGKNLRSRECRVLLQASGCDDAALQPAMHIFHGTVGSMRLSTASVRGGDTKPVSEDPMSSAGSAAFKFCTCSVLKPVKGARPTRKVVKAARHPGNSSSATENGKPENNDAHTMPSKARQKPRAGTPDAIAAERKTSHKGTGGTPVQQR